MKEIRTCLVCRKKDKKSKMNRVCLTKNGLEVDKNQKKQQRASYICYNRNCHLKLTNIKVLNRVFKRQISSENQKEFLSNLKSEN